MRCLKTLEEPRPRGYLFLLSHQPGRLPATVRSRCQHVALRVPDAATVAQWLGVAPAIVLEAQRTDRRCTAARGQRDSG